MKTRSPLGSASTVLKTAGLAAALSCFAAGSLAASQATLNITSFTASAAAFSGTFVASMDPYQSYTMSALDGGGLYGQSLDNFSANDWNLGVNRLAKTTNAMATGNTVQFTDASTAATTAGFNLAAKAANGAYASTVPANNADANGLQQGSFTLLDAQGQAAAGTITFDIYYDMSVATLGGLATDYSQTEVDLLSSSDAGDRASFTDGLVSNLLAGSAGSTSGHFNWSYTLTAGEAAYYTLSGSAIAVAAVPEPGTYALMGLGLAGLGLRARRRARAY